MSPDMRTLFLLVLLTASTTGCNSVAPRKQLRQSQFRAYQMYQQARQYQGELAMSQQMSSQLAMENQGLQGRLADLDQKLQIANSRLGNLADERSRLHEEYKHLLTGLPAPHDPLSGGAARLAELSRRYPQFEFDPLSGSSRFNGDLMFAEGSNELRPDGLKVLQEFVRIMNEPDLRTFNILVVGHTDDQPVVLPGTRAKHETNWELSAHRATAVVRQLAKYGLEEPRMGVAGYNQYQPTAANRDDSGRQRNRRVEIFVLAPEASLAGHDTGKPNR